MLRKTIYGDKLNIGYGDSIQDIIDRILRLDPGADLKHYRFDYKHYSDGDFDYFFQPQRTETDEEYAARVEEMRAEKEEQKRRKIDAEKALLESLLAKYGIPERS